MSDTFFLKYDIFVTAYDIIIKTVNSVAPVTLHFVTEMMNHREGCHDAREDFETPKKELQAENLFLESRAHTNVAAEQVPLQKMVNLPGQPGRPCLPLPARQTRPPGRIPQPHRMGAETAAATKEILPRRTPRSRHRSRRRLKQRQWIPLPAFIIDLWTR